MEYFSFLRRPPIVQRWWRQAVVLSAIGSVALLSAGSATAALTSYTDVEANAWYEESAANLLASGALDASQTELRPDDLATRAEVFKMLVDLNNVPLIYPSTPSFSDVSRSAWYFPYIEAAAKAGWVHGDYNCYGQGLTTCTARPNGFVNRAEMSALLQRGFALSYMNAAPIFPDVQAGTWYFFPVQTAADHCILQGDANTGLARPASSMNRAEMVVMFDRASQNLRYGDDCGVQPEPVGEINSVDARSADTVRVTFNVDLDPNREDDIDRYMLERTSNGDVIDIDDLSVIDARTVDLMLGDDLIEDVTYRVSVDDMRTRGGAIFSDTATFTSDEGVGPELSIASITAVSATRLQLQFNGDLDETTAENESHYVIAGTSGNLGVNNAMLIDGDTVELTLGTALQSQQSYTVTVNSLESVDGAVFSDTIVFLYAASTIQLTATLNGSNEVPSVTTAATGTGTFTLTSTGLQYDITLRTVSGSALTGAHFHRGEAGVEGPVLETISFSGLHASGTWTDLTAEERDDILDGRIYVNVHTTAYPDGEIRGQVVR